MPQRIGADFFVWLLLPHPRINQKVRDSPRVDISAKVGLQLTTEVAAAAAHKAEVLAKASAEATRGGRPRKKANKGKPKDKSKPDKPKQDETNKKKKKKNGSLDDRGKENEASEEGKATKSGCSIM